MTFHCNHCVEVTPPPPRFLGSAGVPDAALTRACYVLRFLLADRLDLRRAYFKSYGRVVILGGGEALSSVPEYASLPGGVAWPTRGGPRSLGAVPLAPVTTGAVENVLCQQDRGQRASEPDDMLLKSLAIGRFELEVSSH